MKLFKLTLIVFALSIFAQPAQLLARSNEEIQADIEAKQKELDQLQKSLKATEGSLQSQQSGLGSITGEIPKIEANIKQLETELQLQSLNLNNMLLSQELNQLELEQGKVKQQELIKRAYIGWKTGYDLPDIDTTKLKKRIYDSIIISDGHTSLQELVDYLNGLVNEINQANAKAAELEKSRKELEGRKASLEDEKRKINDRIAALSKQVAGIRTQKQSAQTQLDVYAQEQKAILDRENSLIKESPVTPPVNTQPPVAGSVYFAGQGRDLNQGHGVGMSQFGALGAALKGWTYKQILAFYYQGTVVEVKDPNRTINVSGYGTMPIDKYVAGAGEVPATACEDVGLTFDTNNIWKCWPREAIKAQAVAFRTYGMYQTSNGSTICVTTSCQVYNGTENMKWAAQETAGEVVLYQGNLISAVYSSDNNQGAGTANNETVWSNYAGDGSPKAYLRSVNDNAFAYRTKWTDFKWKTLNYTMGQIQNMLNIVNVDSAFSGSRGFVNDIRGSIGNLSNVEFIKDPSGRVAKVSLVGSGGSRTMGGWLFKSMWNAWVAGNGTNDYIYSLSIGMYSS